MTPSLDTGIFLVDRLSVFLFEQYNLILHENVLFREELI
jgi:hypothetical protein